MEIYSKRVWLNKNDSPSTGSVVAFHGPTVYHKKEEIVLFLEVADCHNKARLHCAPTDTVIEFIDKMKLLRDSVNDFIIHLEQNAINIEKDKT
jgi:hypothetical protein